MTWTRTLLLSGAAIVLFFAGASAQAQATGYWKYVKTETYSKLCSSDNSCGAYPDSGTGTEGAFTITTSHMSINGTPDIRFGVTFYWSPPPTILIPGTAPDWPIAAKVVLSEGTIIPGVPYTYSSVSFGGNLAQYQPTAELANGCVWCFTGAPQVAWLSIDRTQPVGGVVTFNNLQRSPPLKIDAFCPTAWGGPGVILPRA